MWFVLESDITLSHYISTLGKFVLLALRSYKTVGNTYKLPMDEDQLEKVTELQQALIFNNATLKNIHTYLLTYLNISTTELAKDKWKCPITCYLAVSSLRSDGSWLSYKDITLELARWTYILRSTTLIEMVYQKEKYQDDLTQ